MVVSHVFYVTDMEARHVHHDYYQSLPDFDARLNVSILGRPDADIEFPNIADRFAPYLGWLDHDEVLAVHFEDLINDRASALTRIMEHLLARVSVPSGRRADPRLSGIFDQPKTFSHLPLGKDWRMEEAFHGRA